MRLTDWATSSVAGVLVLVATVLVAVLWAVVTEATGEPDWADQEQQLRVVEPEVDESSIEQEINVGGFPVPIESESPFVQPEQLEQISAEHGPVSQHITKINGIPAVRLTNDPLAALHDLSRNMQYLQATEFGSDANARALFAVMTAIEALEESSDVTGPPFQSKENQ